MANNLQLIQEPTKEFMECLYHISVNFKQTALPEGLRVLKQYISPKYLATKTYEICTLLLFKDNEVDNLIIKLFTQLIAKDEENHFKDAVKFIVYLRSDIVDALMRIAFIIIVSVKSLKK